MLPKLAGLVLERFPGRWVGLSEGAAVQLAHLLAKFPHHPVCGCEFNSVEARTSRYVALKVEHIIKAKVARLGYGVALGDSDAGAKAFLGQLFGSVRGSVSQAVLRLAGQPGTEVGCVEGPARQGKVRTLGRPWRQRVG